MDKFNSFNIEDCKLVAEFIGIMLGDGHLHKKGEKSYDGDLLSISLNRVDEPEYVEYVKHLIFNLFGIIPVEQPRSDSKAIDLKLYNSDILSPSGMMRISREITEMEKFIKDNDIHE